MGNILFWIYLVNAILLIIHEIESAYWKEWDLFRLPGGITGFLLIHLPLLFIILWGLVVTFEGSEWTPAFSVLLSLGGIFAFSIHTYFLRKGKSGFDLPISKILLYAILLVSLVQLAFTVRLMFL
jgi:hypothetical protein